MSERVYNSPEFKAGEEAALYLDSCFHERGWTIRPTTQHEEMVLMRGDRVFERAEDDISKYVEYKFDRVAWRTGNLIIETVSVLSNGVTREVPGWAYTCKADYLIYLCDKVNTVYIWRPDNLRKFMPEITERFPEHTSPPNPTGWRSTGVLVPTKYAVAYFVDQVMKL